MQSSGGWSRSRSFARRAHRILSVVVTALLIAGGAGVAADVDASPKSRPVPTAGAVPWKALPTVRFPIVPLHASLPAADDPSCTANHLVPTAVAQGGFGLDFYYVNLKNVGPEACSLKGQPTYVDQIQTDGRRHRYPSVPISTDGAIAALGTVPSNIALGGSGYVVIVTSHMCPAGYHTRDSPLVAIGLPIGGELATGLAGGGDFHFPCGTPLVSGLGIAMPQPTDPPPAYAGITVHIEHPASVKAGTTLAYVVDLTNTTDRTIALTPCQDYSEQIGHGPDLYGFHSYQLNCSSVGSIRPHHTVRFQMRLGVPAAMQTGPQLLGWAGIAIPNTNDATIIVKRPPRPHRQPTDR